MSTAPQKGTVYLVGAGPGDPDLLTLRAARLLATADLVLYDDLVSPEVLALCGPHTERASVGKRCGRARITQDGIHALLIDAAHRGLSVVRLKSGDPLIFGRAAEELEALRTAGIPVEIVPGISAVFAAGAAVQVPLTDRNTASKLILVAGHPASHKTPPSSRNPADPEAESLLWTGPLPADATLAIYMPGRSAAAIAEELRRSGAPEDLPCIAISQVATPRQHIAAARLANFAGIELGLTPVLILAGYAMGALLPEN
ncbi:uroporphyrinogen-III C-methyltransferase [Terriglobus aquaticus]|uniref:uroporphyrinogen-III C-methyltransferase n=1 Tax=Terriglobus aquaticus TaxID=940139 RepID=A0ABW9KKU6_9BACT|nr:uroporphyrinogen-III C-methyltransferase [Terriglobus aquaticus]